MNDFEALVEPYRAPLRLHCYRMLGSSHDSDDMVQETFVRAFRAQHTLQDPTMARAWLRNDPRCCATRAAASMLTLFLT